MNRVVRGVGLQMNPHVQLFERELSPDDYDFVELLCDEYAAPLDCGLVVDPAMRGVLERYQNTHATLAHGNYGNEFGFEPLDETPGVLRHIEIAHAMNSPWYADHMFYGFRSHSFMWSSPLPFARSELERVAGRAAAFQDRLKMPLLHENAFYYAPFPGTDMPEAEFLAEITHRAQTWHLLDLHNVYANSVNFPDYDAWQFLRTIPLDRVIEIHLAGGVRIEDWYHDFHCAPVPEPVWEMLAYVMQRASRLEAVVLEVQGPAHSSQSPQIDERWPEMVRTDLRRAKAMWTAIKQPTTPEAARAG
ncbi:MAG TPA: DUF692 family protein [Kofleriaceae bacterium]|nr:DUF692 family protein [Kofleriaceae bacterium]